MDVPMDEAKVAMAQLGKREGAKVHKACPGCGMIQPEWPDAGVTVNGTEYCFAGALMGRVAPAGRSGQS